MWAKADRVLRGMGKSLEKLRRGLRRNHIPTRSCVYGTLFLLLLLLLLSVYPFFPRHPLSKVCGRRRIRTGSFGVPTSHECHASWCLNLHRRLVLCDPVSQHACELAASASPHALRFKAPVDAAEALDATHRVALLNFEIEGGLERIIFVGSLYAYERFARELRQVLPHTIVS